MNVLGVRQKSICSTLVDELNTPSENFNACNIRIPMTSCKQHQ